ncbi:hypothetical protein [Synechococcus sp. BIOS-U3-1]|uniref:hypothetical protein n=1 Tax=Synechococcus sp. BIOS-U3-1 TaxID=1400865 RepID=UPI0016468567|nr:hypothetical protein [Synechococcus sp. BIOS-U3-1]
MSFLLDAPLPSQEPMDRQALLHTLMEHQENSWELLVPGPEPHWIEAWRPWLSGAIRVFPKHTSKSLQEVSRIVACGHWLFPVQLQTTWKPTLLEQISSFSKCFSASRWLLGSGSAWLQSREALWHTDENNSVMLLLDEIVHEPGAWSIDLPTLGVPALPKESNENQLKIHALPLRNSLPKFDLEQNQNIFNTLLHEDWPLIVVADQRDNPCWLLIDDIWKQQLGGDFNSNPSSLLQRAEAIGVPPRLWPHKSDQQTTQIPSQLQQLTVHNRRQHGLLLHQRTGDDWPVAAEAWKRSGFRVIPWGNGQHKLHEPDLSKKLRWLTFLRADSLISIDDLDQLRTAVSTETSSAAIPNRLDRGTGLQLTNTYWGLNPSGVTWNAHHPLPPKNTWLNVPHTWLAINTEPPPKPPPKPPLSRSQNFKRRLKYILHSLRID